MNKRWLVALGVIAALVVTIVSGVVACAAPGATATPGPTGVSGGTTGGTETGLLAALRALQVSAGTSGSQVGIWVSGEGKATVVPDIAVVSLGVEVKASTVTQAQSQAAAAMSAVMNALRTFNVADKDVRTQSFNINPVWKYVDRGEPILDGYHVSNMVVVKVRNIANAGAIIDAAAQAGGDLTRVQGISFTVDDPKPLQDKARDDALRDAVAKAQQMARLAGVTLGKPIYITESAGYVQPTKGFMTLSAAEGPAPVTPISPGETEITVSVQMAFAIE